MPLGEFRVIFDIMHLICTKLVYFLDVTKREIDQVPDNPIEIEKVDVSVPCFMIFRLVMIIFSPQSAE